MIKTLISYSTDPSYDGLEHQAVGVGLLCAVDHLAAVKVDVHLLLALLMRFGGALTDHNVSLQKT